MPVSLAFCEELRHIAKPFKASHFDGSKARLKAAAIPAVKGINFVQMATSQSYISYVAAF